MSAPGRHRADRVARPSSVWPLTRRPTAVEQTIPVGIPRHRRAAVHGSHVAQFANPGEHTRGLLALARRSAS